MTITITLSPEQADYLADWLAGEIQDADHDADNEDEIGDDDAAACLREHANALRNVYAGIANALDEVRS